ncbi:hypothetical protein CCP3SC1AL1_3690001 [Gammaproteobacteria bacterium]
MMLRLLHHKQRETLYDPKSFLRAQSCIISSTILLDLLIRISMSVRSFTRTPAPSTPLLMGEMVEETNPIKLSKKWDIQKDIVVCLSNSFADGSRAFAKCWGQQPRQRLR